MKTPGKKLSYKNQNILRNYIGFKVLSCQDKVRSCISRAGFKESRSRNKRSKGPSSICFEGPGGKPRALGCSKQQWVTAATLHCHNLPQHPEERAGQHCWEDVQAWKRDLKGWREAPEEGEPRLHIHHGLHFDLSAISLLKIVQGWQGRSWQWCRKPLPSPCLLACKPLAGSTVLRPPPVATKQRREVSYRAGFRLLQIPSLLFARELYSSFPWRSK